jgi:LacI family transcriptional regulator
VLTANYGIFPEIDGIPVIHLDRDFSEGARPRYVILPDGALGAKLATEEFLRLGHRNIVMINYSYTAPRSAGFAETLRNAGVPGAAERVFLCPEAGKVAPLLVGEIQKKFPGVTGIVTGSDNIAFFLIAALRASGLKVPEDISVSGFGNVREICDLFDLTSVDQHSFDLGFLAAGRLADLVEKKRPPTPFHELLPCGLVRRHSIWPV